MHPLPHRSHASIPGAQRGQAMIMTAVLIILGVLTAVYTTAGTRSISLANRQADDTAKTLLEVKNAMIAWSAARTPITGSTNRRPGELPCPDSDNTGTDPGPTCAAGAIGRVPWKSLGIPEPKDSSGETLWYAISGPFRYFSLSNDAITSDTVGDLTVYHGSSATKLTSQAIAVLIAPGTPLGTQNRDPASTANCTTTGTTIARNLCAENYLDTASSINNATPATNVTPPSFIQATTSSTFNDRVLAITNEDLMPAVEQRVARELITYLNAYRASTGVYPWADLGDGNSNASSGPPANYYNRNRFPCGTAKPDSWAVAGITLPTWLTNGCGLPPRGWQGVIYYAVAKNRLESSGSNCTTCTATSLSVTNSSSKPVMRCSTASPPSCSFQVFSGNADLVLITAGAETTSRGPPNSYPNDWPTDWWSTISSNYIADAANSDNNDDSYVVPASTSHNRNRIYIVR